MSLPVCPEGCDSNLPGFVFDNCNPDVNNGEIAKIYFTTDGNPLSDWTSAAEWDSRLDNTATGASKIRVLTVLGDMPAVGDNEKPISGGRIIEGVKDFLINFDIDETGEDNYNALRAMECNRGNFLVWFETRDGLLHGGSSGIPAKIKLKYAIPRAYTDLITMPGTIKWQARFSPERITSPITSDLGNQ
jgi:hypothetical protein